MTHQQCLEPRGQLASQRMIPAEVSMQKVSHSKWPAISDRLLCRVSVSGDAPGLGSIQEISRLDEEPFDDRGLDRDLSMVLQDQLAFPVGQRHQADRYPVVIRDRLFQFRLYCDRGNSVIVGLLYLPR